MTPVAVTITIIITAALTIIVVRRRTRKIVIAAIEANNDAGLIEKAGPDYCCYC